MKKFIIAGALAVLAATSVNAQAIGLGISGGQGGSIASGAQSGGTNTGGLLASLGFAATNTTSLSGAQNTTSANNLGGQSTSLVENTGTSQSTHAQLGIGGSGGGSTFSGGGLAGGQFVFGGLNIAAQP